jgi:hypothetical protein
MEPDGQQGAVCHLPGQLDGARAGRGEEHRYLPARRVGQAGLEVAEAYVITREQRLQGGNRLAHLL